MLTLATLLVGLATAQPTSALDLTVGSLSGADAVGLVTRGGQPWDRVQIVAASERGRACLADLGACVQLSPDARVVGRSLASARGETLTLTPPRAGGACYQAVVHRRGDVLRSDVVCVGENLSALGL
ncbi:MAG: hypothetical protein ACI8PZ_004008 [Myxococcota bacterium]|jgi:hypothetical protein